MNKSYERHRWYNFMFYSISSTYIWMLFVTLWCYIRYHIHTIYCNTQNVNQKNKKTLYFVLFCCALFLFLDLVAKLLYICDMKKFHYYIIILNMIVFSFWVFLFLLSHSFNFSFFFSFCLFFTYHDGKGPDVFQKLTHLIYNLHKFLTQKYVKVLLLKCFCSRKS